MIDLFHELSQQCSKATTEKYSTSFSSAIKLLHSDLQTPVFNIYGFVKNGHNRIGSDYLDAASDDAISSASASRSPI